MVAECVRAYSLIVANMTRLFSKDILTIDIKLRRIIVSGDSAGGFLSLNVTASLIQNNLKKPDGLLLIYPCIIY